MAVSEAMGMDDSRREGAGHSARGLSWRVMLLVAVLGALGLVCARGPVAVARASDTLASGTPTGTVTTPTPSVVATHAYRVIGTSVRKRPIVLETFGKGPRRVLIMGGLHGNEYGIPVVKAFARYVRAHPSVVPSGTQLAIVAVANPDGYAKRRRTNAHNVDLNRNFPTRNWKRGRSASGASWGVRAGSEPETKALVALLGEGGFVRVVSMHSRGGILDWDGPGGYTLAKKMSRRSHVRLHRLGARHGSMGTYVPQRHRVPIVTWELARRTLTARVRAGMLAAVR